MSIAKTVLRAARSVLMLSATCLAASALAGAALSGLAPRMDPTPLWLAAHDLPAVLRAALLIAFGLGVLTWRWQPRVLRRVTWGVVLGMNGLVLADAAVVHHVTLGRPPHSGTWISLSLLVAASLSAWLGVRAPAVFGHAEQRASAATPARLRQWVGLATGLALVAAGWIAAHLVTYGRTNYARPADAIVVLGAAVRPDGSASPALRDRVMTACDLHHKGLAPVLVLSGAHTPGRPVSEPECMRHLALEAGVPAEALVLDETGWTTEGTINATRALASKHAWKRILFVSHDYHLARIKLRAERRGLSALTVPAKETVHWRGKPLAFGREVLAFGWNLIRP